MDRLCTKCCVAGHRKALTLGGSFLSLFAQMGLENTVTSFLTLSILTDITVESFDCQKFTQ